MLYTSDCLFTRTCTCIYYVWYIILLYLHFNYILIFSSLPAFFFVHSPFIFLSSSLSIITFFFSLSPSLPPSLPLSPSLSPSLPPSLPPQPLPSQSHFYHMPPELTTSSPRQLTGSPEVGTQLQAVPFLHPGTVVPVIQVSPLLSYLLFQMKVV